MTFRGFTREYITPDGSSIREDLLGGLHVDPATVTEEVLQLRLQHRLAGFKGTFGANKDAEGKGDAFRFAMEYIEEYGELPHAPTVVEEMYR
jgi:hypothetical protein|tara:strand:- start:3380 stop:3655 length:276 start_codon:yes stop_codon:yes gene_type:complete